MGLRESQRFLTTLISNLPGYVYRCTSNNGKWNVDFASDGIFDLTGYTAQEMLKDISLYSSLVHEDDKSKQQQIVLAALKKQESYQITYRIRTITGKIKWVWEQGRGVYSEDGHLVATEGFITDISEKKIAEEELIRKNRELATLNQTGQYLSKLDERSDIIKTIQTAVGRLFDTDNFQIALYDEARKKISFPVNVLNNSSKQYLVTGADDEIIEYVMNNKSPLLINNNLHKILEQAGINSEKVTAKSIMCAPMLAGDKVLGAITLQNFKFENAYKESQIEILQTIATQAAIALQNAQLYDEVMKSLNDKEILLQEIHHRVKNNLQIMASLIKLQSNHIKDNHILEIFRESENRIRSMAIVHTKLYSTKDYERINFGEYVRSLTESLYTTYGMRLNRVKINIDINDVMMNIDTAIPCGLIINELVSNAIKHAFPNRKEGEIKISLAAEKTGHFVLIVKDNGIGLPQDFSSNKAKTLGIELVTLLTHQLNGKLKINGSGGAEFNIRFSESTYKPRN